MLTNLSSGKMSRKTYKQNVREKATRASVVPPDDDRVESLGNLLKLRAGFYISPTPLRWARDTSGGWQIDCPHLRSHPRIQKLDHNLQSAHTRSHANDITGDPTFRALQSTHSNLQRYGNGGGSQKVWHAFSDDVATATEAAVAVVAAVIRDLALGFN
ncbi:hypothetical protein TIFTF001_002884 [Ficus carica]|uniref:Uncharacterized protein n=1 Tax=Ficus carica TaxID=3494 RepID=A0AA88CQE7_FICCA|nr:hypothetical protein TIFTF001_002884 [Ficus carica]